MTTCLISYRPFLLPNLYSDTFQSESALTYSAIWTTVALLLIQITRTSLFSSRVSMSLGSLWSCCWFTTFPSLDHFRYWPLQTRNTPNSYSFEMLWPGRLAVTISLKSLHLTILLLIHQLWEQNVHLLPISRPLTGAVMKYYTHIFGYFKQI